MNFTSTEALLNWFDRSDGVTTDTRRCGPGKLFFALKGERFDGNAFASEALAAGCLGAVVDDPALAITNKPMDGWPVDGAQLERVRTATLPPAVQTGDDGEGESSTLAGQSPVSPTTKEARRPSRISRSSWARRFSLPNLNRPRGNFMSISRSCRQSMGLMVSSAP